ncbi:hypothetical protein SFC79_12595 [Nocardioides sp. S-58]|uniref:Cation-transporting P-type ATPase C-terminal domain-containing protein n=1 Tax=Nocardioides renjunii TaxID=3095075 RepID=A0ABU5KDS1_9ACTN|nr:hypothetical protein [Nocardioides sp. S-58]MDZ5662605.1 hypothetical protein [Nocardioides sp. S-58]
MGGLALGLFFVAQNVVTDGVTWEDFLPLAAMVFALAVIEETNRVEEAHRRARRHSG